MWGVLLKLTPMGPGGGFIHEHALIRPADDMKTTPSKQVACAILALAVIAGVSGSGCRRAVVAERDRAMVVNSFELPDAFVKLCEAIERDEAPMLWELKENVDAYGRPWEVAGLTINSDPQEIQADTDWLSNAFLHEERFQQDAVNADQAGFIADFPGVANLVWFGRGSDGLPYAFDFGTDPKEPSVVYWGMGYWRRVAPDFAAFIALFGDALAEDEAEGDEDDGVRSD